jgi:phage baseplate assembly protein W
VLTRIKTQVEELKDPDNQDIGVFFLAALDELEPRLDLLKYRQNPNVRGVTQFVLQWWLSRGNQHGSDLARILLTSLGFRAGRHKFGSCFDLAIH